MSLNGKLFRKYFPSMLNLGVNSALLMQISFCRLKGGCSRKVRKHCLSVCCCCYWHGPSWHESGARVSHLAMSYHYLCLLLSDESSPAPCRGAGLYLMGSFSRGLLGGSLLQTHLRKVLWISWLPRHSLLLSIRWSPRLYPSVNGPGEQWMQHFLIPEMPLSTLCLAVLW